MRFAAPVRNVMGIKTIMNLIGPLSNPAGAAYQMLGVYSKDLLSPVAEASKMLGAKRVMVVVSEDGFDEISPCAPTFVIEIDEKNQKKEYTINPSDYGIPSCKSEDLDGGTGKEKCGSCHGFNPGQRASRHFIFLCLKCWSDSLYWWESKNIKRRL